MGKVHRRGTAVAAKKANRRHGRNCRSAPMTPTGLAVDFRRREIGKRNRWRAVVTWDPVDEDVAARALTPEAYQVQLRATDASGDAVETALQAEAAIESGAGFTVHSGSAAVVGISRELNAAGDVIKKTLTGLTVGIATQVNFYSKRQGASGTPRLKHEVWNVTDGVTLGAKNEDITSHFGGPRLFATRTFTPATGKTYEARVSWTSGTGIAEFSHATWHGLGNAALWTKMVQADESPLNALYGAIPRPRSWYYAARVRTMNRHAGTRCWSAWTSWSTPTIPVTGATYGPPAPTGLVQTIDKVEGVRRAAWRVRARWNELPWWIPPDDDAREGADRYIVQLAVSSQSDGTPLLNVRTESMPADDADPGVLAKKDWVYRILGKRYYRSRVAAVSEGKRGPFSAWTAWASPGGAPNPPTGITVTNPNRSVLVVKWLEPADPTDVDRYKVEVIRASDSTVVDTNFTTGLRHVYHIPKADRNINHRARVRSIEDPGTLDEDDTPAGWDTGEESSTDTSSDVADTAPIIADIHNENDDPVLRTTGFPRCKLVYSAGANLTNDTIEYIRFGNQVVDTDSFQTPTSDALSPSPDSTYNVTFPFDGQYEIVGHAAFNTDQNGRRKIVYAKNGAAPNTENQMVIAAIGGEATRFSFTSVIDVNAGDFIRMGAFQTSGGNLALTSARITIRYLGDA